jgi:hypothetical protein
MTDLALLGQHALALARRGLFVFPCWPRSKEPATSKGCKEATVDADLVEHWWRREPGSNIGVATGKQSGIFVLDVDGEDAEVELKKLEDKHGALPATVEAITGKGRHLYFSWPDLLVRNSAGKIAAGLDVRGEGGYVLAPPSIHPSGRAYAWSVDSAREFAPAPPWLLAMANGDRNGGNGLDGRNGTATPPEMWRDLVRNGVEEGARNDSIARLAGHLLRNRVGPFVVLELLQAWNATHCRPPLDAAEIERTVNSICGLERKRRGR